MSNFVKFSKYQGLHRIEPRPDLVEDTSINSPDYFRIDEFPDILTAGKNMFLISGNINTLAPLSEIKFEVISSDDKAVYTEIPSYKSVSGQRMITIWIYPWTPAGLCLITLYAKLKKGGSVRWRRLINIDPYSPNKTKIIFGQRPRVAIKEVRKEYLTQTYPIGDIAAATINNGAELTLYGLKK